MEGQGNPLVKKDNSLAGQDRNLATQDGSSTEKKKQASGRKGPSKEHFTYDYQVRMYPDGKYHWLYDLHMLKNPAVFFEVIRLFAITIGIFGILLFFIFSCADGVSLDSTVTNTPYILPWTRKAWCTNRPKGLKTWHKRLVA